MFLHPLFLRPFTRRSQASRVATRAFVTLSAAIRVPVEIGARRSVALEIEAPAIRVSLEVPTVPTSEP